MDSDLHAQMPYGAATGTPHHGMIPNRVSTALTHVISHRVPSIGITNPQLDCDDYPLPQAIKFVLKLHGGFARVTIPDADPIFPSGLT